MNTLRGLALRRRWALYPFQNSRVPLRQNDLPAGRIYTTTKVPSPSY